MHIWIFHHDVELQHSVVSVCVSVHVRVFVYVIQLPQGSDNAEFYSV
jgi:hypothetical protein